MNIGYLVETPITEKKQLYGAQISFVNLLAELKKYGVNPFVVVSEEWEITDILRSLDISYMVTPIYEFFTSVDGAYGEYHDSTLQEKRNAASYKLMLEYFKANKVELVHMNTRFCGLLGAKVAKTLTIPYIFHIREFLKDDFGLVFKNEKLANELIGDSTLLIAISESIHNCLANIYPNTKIETIYNGVDAKKYSCPKCARFENEVVRIAIAGRVIQHKGQFDAIKAVETLCNKASRKIELFVIGYRPDEITDYEQMLVEYVKAQHLSDVIKFIPFTDKVEDVLRTCDIGLLCSKKEAFGRVTVEYMLSNLLAIGTNSGGTPELIKDKETGLLYEEGNFLQLANSIDWAINNHRCANEIICAGNKLAISNYSVSANAQNVFRAYQRILSPVSNA